MYMDYDYACSVCGHGAYICGPALYDRDERALNAGETKVCKGRGAYADPCACLYMQEEDPCPSLPLAQASVRDQPYGRMFNPREALLHGTLFPCLVSRY